MPDYLLAINQGTTATQATLYDHGLRPVACRSQSVNLTETAPVHFEQDPLALWASVQHTAQGVLADQELTAGQLRGICLTNQRETTVLWDRASGLPLHAALNWQDRRMLELCEDWRHEGREPLLQAKTGLVLDPYFSAPKLKWLLDYVPGARSRAEAGELCFGTVDSWLLWRLTGGQVHCTDATNAARTLLFNIHHQCWDDELLTLFDIPAALLPEVKDSADQYGDATPSFLGQALPICAVIGDQQAALVGQACFHPGTAKATYDDACFALVNTGNKAVASQNRLLTTLAYRLDGEVSYAVEGGLFMAGSIIDWLQRDLHVLGAETDLADIVSAVPLSQSEIVVPSFGGNAVPYHERSAPGAIFGLTRDTRGSHLVAAALRSVAFQTEDLLKAMRYDQVSVRRLKVDGGELATPWFLQTLADITGIEVVTCDDAQAATRGAAMLGALHLGWYESLDQLADLPAPRQIYRPRISEPERDRLLRRWDEAVRRLNAPLA